MTGTTEDLTVEMDIGEAETLIRVSGTRDAAVIVYSASGEEIYLPPDDFDAPPGTEGTSPYDPAPGGRSPYEGAVPDDSPYEAAGEGSRPAGGDAEGHGGSRQPVGVESTPEGFRIRHPEPVTDVRLLR